MSVALHFPVEILYCKYFSSYSSCKENTCKISHQDYLALYRIFLEEIQREEIVGYLDVCVDGEFVVSAKDAALKWRGSSNQRVIDVPATLREGRVVLHAD